MGKGPTDPVEYDPDDPYTDEKIEEEGYAVGLDVWDVLDKAHGNYLSDGSLANGQLWSLQKAERNRAMRGDGFEAWLKRRRDEQGDRTDAAWRVPDDAWHVLDNLLDDYREHADTGTPLDQVVQGPHPEEV